MKRTLFIIVFIVLNFTVAKSQIYTGTDRPFSNPSFMMGTNFGQYFQTLYRLGRYDDMLKFTSQESIKKYGKDKILDYYQNCDFGYKIKIINKTTDGKYYILSYNANIMATNKVVRMKTVVENDTAKIVLDNLNIIK
jgi:hypothetical protein